MPLDSGLSSPHRRTQGLSSSQSTFKKQFAPGDMSLSSLMQRHRFLLIALVLLVVLCTIYLYFAVTMGSNGSCSGLIGTEKHLCLAKQAKSSMTNGKLKFF